MEILKYLQANYDFDPGARVVALPASRWTSYPALLSACGLLRGVEIGVYRCQFGAALARAVPGLQLTGVDAWQSFAGYKDFGWHDLEEAEQHAREVAEKHGIALIRGWSVDVAAQFADGSLDFVFIDGNHAFPAVVADLEAWSRKVRPGGLISGHDFFRRRHSGYGVREAVPAWCEHFGIRPLFLLQNDRCPSWMYVNG